MASSPVDEQLAMSPAPTITGSPGGGAVVTVMLDVPVTPLPLALIVAVPGATAVTSPDEETVATPSFDDDQLMVVVALAGETVAVTCIGCPPTTIVALDGDTLIDLTLGPPFAKNGAVGAVDGCRWSEQDSANMMVAAIPADTIRFRMRDS